uniref:Uncharacterized protein n=1 Tax=Odontella aurita TaxID=265563 RepID=A0A7S4NAB6_9STRA
MNEYYWDMPSRKSATLYTARADTSVRRKIRTHPTETNAGPPRPAGVPAALSHTCPAAPSSANDDKDAVASFPSRAAALALRLRRPTRPKIPPLAFVFPAGSPAVAATVVSVDDDALALAANANASASASASGRGEEEGRR